MPQTSGSQQGWTESSHPQGHLAMSKDGSVTTREVLLASSGYRPGTLNILPCTWQSPRPRNIQPKMSLVMRMRKAALEELMNSGLTAEGGRCRGWVKGGTKLSWFLSVRLKKTEEAHYFYNLSWVQKRGLCGAVCGTHHPGEEHLPWLPYHPGSCLTQATPAWARRAQAQKCIWLKDRTPRVNSRIQPKDKLGYSNRRNLTSILMGFFLFFPFFFFYCIYMKDGC